MVCAVPAAVLCPATTGSPAAALAGPALSISAAATPPMPAAATVAARRSSALRPTASSGVCSLGPASLRLLAMVSGALSFVVVGGVDGAALLGVADYLPLILDSMP